MSRGEGCLLLAVERVVAGTAADSVSGRVVDGGGGDVVGDSDDLDTPLKIPNDRDSFLASLEPSLSSPKAAKVRSLKSSGPRCTYSQLGIIGGEGEIQELMIGEKEDERTWQIQLVINTNHPNPEYQ